MAEQLGAHALRIGALLVDLVDGDDHRHLRGLGVIDRLDRLRLDAVVSRDHEHDDVRHLGASLAHGGEGLVARRVDESDLVAKRRHHLIGADMLGDAAGLLAHHIGRADGVEQGRLAVIDMAHDGDHRCARLGVLGEIGGADEALFHVCLRHAAHDVAELLGDDLSGIGIDHIGDLVHLTVFHQELDDVDAALGHAVGELLDSDGLGNHHFALNLLLRLGPDGLLLLPLAVALQRGKAPLALLLVERIGDGEAAANPALLAGARLDRALLLVARVLGAGSFLLLFLDDEMLAGDFLAFAPGLGLGLVPRVFLLLALLRLVLLLGLDLVGHDAERGLFLGLFALHRLALTRFSESPEPSVLFLIGKGAQHHARRGAGRRRARAWPAPVPAPRWRPWASAPRWVVPRECRRPPGASSSPPERTWNAHG